jgi:hypothetical protein
MVTPKSIFIHKLPAENDEAVHACGESSIDLAWPVPIASLLYTDEYVRDASGGFVVTITSSSEYLPASHSMQTEAPAAETSAQAGVVHSYPATIEHKLLQPSPSSILPSSQVSLDAFFPSPQGD